MSLKAYYDVIVAGGGINGAGIARDLALRGVNCLVVEKNDFGAGTSSASSGMIHGGPRYLLSDRNVTRLSCLDSGYIQKIAPHLIFRIPFLFPVYAGEDRSPFQAQILLEGAESFFSAYDRFVPLKNGKPHARLSPEEAARLEPGLETRGLVGAVTFDEWGIDVPRLVIANVVDAAERGAGTVNHAEIVRVIIENNAFRGVEIRDTLTGETTCVSGKILVNATGPWSPRFAAMMGLTIRLRGGKGVHLVVDRRLTNVALVASAIDGRDIFMLPHENNTLIGTTDDDYFGSLDDQRVTEDEIQYLLEGITRVFPAVGNARLIHSFSGVRPTLYKRGVYEDDLTREHELIDHEERDGLGGVVSLVGGKLASYRIMAEETCELVCEKLQVDVPCRTHVTALPGGDAIPDVRSLAREYGTDPLTASRLAYRHGSRAVRILDSLRAEKELGTIVCGCESVTSAEIRHAVRNEFARTASDVRRRTRLGVGPCQGTNCLTGALPLVGGLNSGAQAVPTPEHTARALDRYLDEWWLNRSAVLSGDQLRQEEIFQALHYA